MWQSSPALHRARIILRFSRPLFLLGGVLGNTFGILIAYTQGYPFNFSLALLGQFYITCIQLFTQYANEYFDVVVDRLGASNRTWFSGGSGVLPDGLLPRSTVQNFMKVVLGAGLLGMIAAAWLSSPWILLSGLLAVAGGWYYSAPPLALKNTGMGELSAAVIVTILTPATGYMLQSNRFSFSLLSSCLPLFFMNWGMLIVVAMPDIEADQIVGKRTLAVRLGLKRTALLYDFLVIAGLALIIWLSGSDPTAAWITPFALIAASLVTRYAWRPRKRPNLMTASVVLLFAASSLIYMAALLLGEK